MPVKSCWVLQQRTKLLRTSGLSGCPEQLFLWFVHHRWRLTSRHHTLAFRPGFRLYGGVLCQCRFQVLPFLLTGSRGFPNRFCRVQCLGDQVQNEFPLRIFTAQVLALLLQVPLDPLEEFL